MNRIQDYLTADQVARRIGYSRSYVYQLVTKEQIPFIRYGTKVLFDEKQIKEWMNNRLTANNIQHHE